MRTEILEKIKALGEKVRELFATRVQTQAENLSLREQNLGLAKEFSEVRQSLLEAQEQLQGKNQQLIALEAEDAKEDEGYEDRIRQLLDSGKASADKVNALEIELAEARKATEATQDEQTAIEQQIMDALGLIDQAMS